MILSNVHELLFFKKSKCRLPFVEKCNIFVDFLLRINKVLVYLKPAFANIITVFKNLKIKAYRK